MNIPKFLTRAAMDGHGLLGLLFGGVIFMLCLSGSIVVMVDQLSVWERPDAPTVHRVSRDDAGRIALSVLATARAEHLDHDVFINFPTDELPRMTAIGTDGKGGHRDWNIDAAGKLVPYAEVPWVEFLQLLHFNLTVPGAIGRYLVGIFGTLLLASIVTGLFAHRRILKDAFRLRLGGSGRLSNADFHNRIGVWALPFHLIVALTGSLLGLAGLITALLALAAYRGDQEKALASLLGPQAVDSKLSAPLPDMPAILRGIDKAAPGAEITQLSFEHPGTEGQHVRALIAAPYHLARNEGLLFDAQGRLKWTAGFTDGNAGARIFGMITPLHYGTYGGVALKIIYLLLGSGLTLIVATGGNIWVARRREQGRPVPRLERMWAATIWGQPLIVVLIAIGLLWTPLPATAVYWALTALLWVAALALPDGVTTRRVLRWALGIALLLLAILHGLRWASADPVAVIIDIALALGGAVLLAKTAPPFPVTPSFAFPIRRRSRA